MDDSYILQKDSCHNIIYPDWHTRAMNYPTYYPEDCLDKFDFEEDYFRCKFCHSKALYYRFDMGFESTRNIFIPNRIDISVDSLRKKGAPCFVLTHILCLPFSVGCCSSWKLIDTQPMIEILVSELDEEWIAEVAKWE